jgi:hypothetical protein
MVEDKIFKKIAMTLFVVVVIFLSMNLIRIFSEMKRNDKLLEYYVNRQKHESDSIIALKQKRIQELILEVKVLDSQIHSAQIKIDSLEKQKARIEYVYLNKLKEIDKYDAKQIEQYWQNEFK